MILCLAFTKAFGATLEWDANVETNIVGYRVYVGTQSRQYDTTFDVGLTTRKSLDALPAGPAYFLAVTAYDGQGLESEFSQEVQYEAEEPPVVEPPVVVVPPVVGEFTTATPLTNVTVYAGQIATFATTVAGTGPFVFVWKKDGAVMEGMTYPMLRIVTDGFIDGGIYSVEVTGARNSVTNSARLNVLMNDPNWGAVPLKVSLSGAGSPAVISFLGLAARQYVVQTSSDLQTWQSIEMLLATNTGPNQWVDEDAPNHAKRFYRVLGSRP